jgi:hypothetical protein
MATNLLVKSDDIRETRDVDFALVTTYPDPVSDVVSYLFSHKQYGVERLPNARLPKATILKLIVDGIGVDFIVINDKAYSACSLKRSLYSTFMSKRMRLLSPEDIFLYKAIAGRPKDVQPMVALAETHGFNWRYVNKWSRRLGVAKFIRSIFR